MAQAEVLEVRNRVKIQISINEKEARYLMALVGRASGKESYIGDALFEQLSDIIGDMPYSPKTIRTSQLERELWDLVNDGE